MGRSHQVSTTAKQIVAGTMNGTKTLGMSRRLEASHLALVGEWVDVRPQP
jgi:hypothetical protein